MLIFQQSLCDRLPFGTSIFHPQGIAPFFLVKSASSEWDPTLDRFWLVITWFVGEQVGEHLKGAGNVPSTKFKTEPVLSICPARLERRFF